MQAYICTVCGFLYDDESADHTQEGKPIKFRDLDFDWICPSCGVKGHLFKQTTSTRPPDIAVESTEEKK